MKRIFAVILAAALCLSFAGCYDENNSWAAKKGDEALSIGSYIFFLNSAYSQAQAKVSTEENVLKAEITDYLVDDIKLTGEEWVKNRAMNYTKSYFFLSDKFDQYGLEFTEEEQSSINSMTETLWTYSKTTYEDMGIAKSSVDQAYSLYNEMYQKVLFAIYNEGGDLEVSEDEMKEFFENNFTHYEYFSVSLTTTDDDGNSVDMTDDEKTAAKEEIDALVERINSNALTMEEAAAEYAVDNLGSEENSTYQAAAVLYNDNMSDTFSTALANAKDNEVVVTETTSGYFIIRKLPIMDKYNEYIETEGNKLNLFGYMKGDEFSDYVTEQSEHYDGFEINEKALGTVKLSKLIGDDKKGTSSAESSEVEEDVTSSTSSEAEDVESDAVESEVSSEAE